MDVYPCLTYRDVAAALKWLADAFGVKPLVPDSEANEAVENAAVAHGDGMVLIVPSHRFVLLRATEWSKSGAGCGECSTRTGLMAHGRIFACGQTRQRPPRQTTPLIDKRKPEASHWAA